MKYRHIRKKRTKKQKRNRKPYTRRLLHGGSQGTIVFKLEHSPGFFASFYSLCKTYIYSQKTNSKFFIDNSDWKYSYKTGWHDYFTSLTYFTPVNTLNVEQSSTVKYQYADHPQEGGQSTSMILGHQSSYQTPTPRGGQSLVLSGNALSFYNSWTTNTLPIYTISDHINCLKEIYKLNTVILEKANSFINSIGRPYKSLYVRRGDKALESPPIDTQTIITTSGFKDDASNIFIQTDDYTVVEEVQKILPSCKLFTMTSTNSRGIFDNNILKMSADDKKMHTEELLASVQVFLQGKECWTDHRSNVGRFHKLAEFEKVKLYPIDDSIKNLTKDKPFKGDTF